MKVQILERTDRKMRLVIDGISPAFANALRRACIGEVPILAIDTVDFYINDSPAYDEVIAHRLAMIPLVFDRKAYVMREDCKCEGKGCSNCQVVLVIDKKGPAIVYTKDMRSADPAVKPLYPNMPIVELFAGQRLKLEATAVLGLGKEHAKWQAARAGYQYWPGAVLKGKIANPAAVVRACPRQALRINAKVSVSADCDLCGECAKTARPAGVLKIVGDRTKFIFNIETISGLSVEQVWLSAIDALKKMVKEFARQLKMLK